MSLNSPPQIIRIAGKLAIDKASYSTKKILTLSFMAGAYIGFGGLLAIVTLGGVPGIAENNPGLAKLLFGAMFPVGIIMVVMAGAELFTGNNAYFMPNVLSKKQTWLAPLKNWGVVYFGNFLGCLFIAFFITHLTEVVSAEPWAHTVQNIAQSKISNPFYKTFLKGIGANWLVCLSLWMGMSSHHTSGKILGIWWPVMAFVTIGFEHCIANMFFIPLAIFEGANITWSTFVFKNLIPATLGNLLGGAFFVGTLYWFAYIKESNAD